MDIVINDNNKRVQWYDNQDDDMDTSSLKKFSKVTLDDVNQMTDSMDNLVIANNDINVDTNVNIDTITLDMKLLTLDTETDICNAISDLNIEGSSKRQDYIDLMRMPLYILDEPSEAQCNVFLTRGSPWTTKSYMCNVIVYDMCIIYNNKQLFISFEIPGGNQGYKVMDNNTKFALKEQIIKEQIYINYFCDD